MRDRILIALLLIPIGAFFIFTSFFNNFLFFLALLTVAIVINYEVHTMLETRGFHFYLWVNSITVTMSALSYYLFSLGVYDIGYFYILQIMFLSLFLLTIFVIESSQGKFDSSIANIGVSLLLFLLTGVFFPFLILLKAQASNGWFVFLVLFLTWMADAGGFFGGKLFGKNKLSSLSSPNKTIEGYIGVFVFSIFSGVLCFGIQYWFRMPTNFSLFQFILLALAMALTGSIGDLAESTIKRWSKAKDSSNLLRGHGGFFDRFDSVLFSVPVFYVIIKFMGY
jgi:phosphatidate cytidylyltransferase